ncbi:MULTISPECIES: hypothetical protein [unclassified Streptomyces]|uniref:hypothetical protein n=1 Tax=unclassified Streptomyces TaxID=2593676 RepID=UPI00226D7E42|nr:MULTISPECIES: hypothetical protein [unclassified Streptomyces]MCY0923450.1 hypothetical protein [Streptomyces sp. H27-G5]MCY0961874.1 hypothetical protein [Streptomyces sp. H27-H5]
MSASSWARATARRKMINRDADADVFEADAVPAGETESAAEESAYLTRADMAAFADRLGMVMAETPEERRHRLHLERERHFEEQGETRVQRRIRHRQEQREQRHRDTALHRIHHSERARRFRKWVVLTAASASLGFAFHLVEALSVPPRPVAYAALVGSWVVDWRIRGRGAVRLSEVRGVGLVIAVIVRIPFASALAVVSGLGPLFGLSPFHH